MIENPITSNLLIQRDWRALNRRWRHPLVRNLLSIALIQIVVCSAYAWIREGHLHGEEDLLLLFYFSLIHLFIHLAVPWNALKQVQSPRMRAQIDEICVTPTPPKHIFWWLWMRSFAPAIAFVMAVYLPTLLAYPWLYETNPLGDLMDRKVPGRWPYFLTGEIISDVFMIAMLCLPWIRFRTFRLAILIACFAFLAGWALVSVQAQETVRTAVLSYLKIPDTAGKISKDEKGNWMIKDDPTPYELSNCEMVFAGSYARWHPLITNLYFFISIGWMVALATALGLRYPSSSSKPFWLLLIFGPLCEWLAYHVAFGAKSLDLYTSIIGPLWLMLLFYSMSFGIFWMGIKWNLMIWLSRKKIEA
ncbi:hypothetical protein HY256_10865 [Candidatus Sumerlaeota bacterium]|nr:hypothetical protein [Candidatus Sumerlaeota bacterium]